MKRTVLIEFEYDEADADIVDALIDQYDYFGYSGAMSAWVELTIELADVNPSNIDGLWKYQESNILAAKKLRELEKLSLEPSIAITTTVDGDEVGTYNSTVKSWFDNILPRK